MTWASPLGIAVVIASLGVFILCGSIGPYWLSRCEKR